MIHAFCRDMSEAIKDGRGGNANKDALHHACLRAASSVKACPCRIHSATAFKELNGVGPAIASIVVDNLWVRYPPEPAVESEQDAWKTFLGAHVRQPPECEQLRPGSGSRTLRHTTNVLAGALRFACCALSALTVSGLCVAIT